MSTEKQFEQAAFNPEFQCPQSGRPPKNEPLPSWLLVFRNPSQTRRAKPDTLVAPIWRRSAWQYLALRPHALVRRTPKSSLSANFVLKQCGCEPTWSHYRSGRLRQTTRNPRRRCRSWISSGTQDEQLGRQRARKSKTDRRDRQLDVGVCDALALIPIDPAAFSYQTNDLKSVRRTARRRFLLDTFLGREISNLPATSFRDSLRFTFDSIERNALSLGAIEASNQMQDCCVKCFSSPAPGHQTTHVCANARTVEGARRKHVAVVRYSRTKISQCNRYWIAEAYRRVARRLPEPRTLQRAAKAPSRASQLQHIHLERLCTLAVSRRQAPGEAVDLCAVWVEFRPERYESQGGPGIASESPLPSRADLKRRPSTQIRKTVKPPPSSFYFRLQIAALLLRQQSLT